MPSHTSHEIEILHKYLTIFIEYLRDKKKERKKGAQKKGGENSPVLPPLDSRLPPLASV